MSNNIIKTKVSQANWCTPGLNRVEYNEARFPGYEKKDGIYWLDELFEGGLYVPAHRSQKGKPLTLLLTGPPGSGKTTLALEMCYRLSNNADAPHSLYLTAEGESWKLKDKAIRYGWDSKSFYTIQDETQINSDDFSQEVKKQQEPRVVIWSARDVYNVLKNGSEVDKSKFKFFWKNFNKISSPIVSLLQKISPDYNIDIASILISTINQFVSSGEDFEKDDNKNKSVYNEFGFLVIDSLDVISNEESAKYLFEKFLTSISGGPSIVIFIVDPKSEDKYINYLEHVCDVLLHVDYYYESSSKYLIRTIEVKKARYQSHVWGKHQLKVYPPPIQEKNQRAHPYRKDGGIFIYPSIHWFLSKYKRKAPTIQHEPMETPLKYLNIILGEKQDIKGGLPRGRCTAFIGARGAHKSHLGYYHILNMISGNKAGVKIREKGLIISLRDDEGLAKDAMRGLLANTEMKHFIGRIITQQEAGKELDGYLENDDLEILYFPPGYITPEEFYHRVLMSLLRLKMSKREDEDVNITVLFNSLDQLSARFPLCAKEDVFIPGLIDTFNAESTSSIFIAVDEPGQPAHQYGLLIMADLILSFSQSNMNTESYFGHLEAVSKKTVIESTKEEFGKDIQTVTVKVERFAGGQRAGEGGILELVQTEKLQKLYKFLFNRESRLEFIPFSPNFSHGINVIHNNYYTAYM
jgi:KaiC/GvpD/RAD55 family RecA-like ATPase